MNKRQSLNKTTAHAQKETAYFDQISSNGAFAFSVIQEHNYFNSLNWVSVITNCNQYIFRYFETVLRYIVSSRLSVCMYNCANGGRCCFTTCSLFSKVYKPNIEFIWYLIVLYGAWHWPLSFTNRHNCILVGGKVSSAQNNVLKIDLFVTSLAFQHYGWLKSVKNIYISLWSSITSFSHK